MGSLERCIRACVFFEAAKLGGQSDRAKRAIERILGTDIDNKTCRTLKVDRGWRAGDGGGCRDWEQVKQMEWMSGLGAFGADATTPGRRVLDSHGSMETQGTSTDKAAEKRHSLGTAFP